MTVSCGEDGKTALNADRSGQSSEKEVKFSITVRSFAILGMGMTGGSM